MYQQKNNMKLPLSEVINWVPVTERLPELTKQTNFGKESEPILCLHSEGHMESCILNENIDFEDEPPYWSYEQDGDLCDTVTHWAEVKPLKVYFVGNRDLYMELRTIGLSHENCDKVLEWSETLSTDIK